MYILDTKNTANIIIQNQAIALDALSSKNGAEHGLHSIETRNEQMMLDLFNTLQETDPLRTQRVAIINVECVVNIYFTGRKLSGAEYKIVDAINVKNLEGHNGLPIRRDNLPYKAV